MKNYANKKGRPIFKSFRSPIETSMEATFLRYWIDEKLQSSRESGRDRAENALGRARPLSPSLGSEGARALPDVKLTRQSIIKAEYLARWWATIRPRRCQHTVGFHSETRLLIKLSRQISPREIASLFEVRSLERFPPTSTVIIDSRIIMFFFFPLVTYVLILLIERIRGFLYLFYFLRCRHSDDFSVTGI